MSAHRLLVFLLLSCLDEPIGAFPYDDIIPRLREELDRIISERGDVAGAAAGV